MDGQRTSNQLRCFCRRQPLLATYGLDDKGKLYVHVKVYKSRRIYGEILITSGDIQLRCRECLRWYKLNITSNKPQLEETSEPESVSDTDPVAHG